VLQGYDGQVVLLLPVLGQDLPHQQVAASLQITPKGICDLDFVETSIKAIGAQDHAVIRLNSESTRIPIDFLWLGLPEITGQ
jgi:hypothetical protein